MRIGRTELVIKEQSRLLGVIRRLGKAVDLNAIVKGLSGAAVIWKWLPDDQSHAAVIHHAFYRESWKEEGIAGKAFMVACFVLWAPTLVVLVVIYTWRCANRVKRVHGKGVFRQIGEQVWLAVRYAIPPPWYYMFDFYDDALRGHALEYIYRFETKSGLYNMLRDRLASSATTMALSDKAAFALRCEVYSVPVIAALATASNGQIKRLDGKRTGLPHQGLFLKPLRGAGGRGAARWEFIEQTGNYRGPAGIVLTESGLSAHVKALSEAEDYVIRALAENHPEIADLSLVALNTVRVLTCLNESGDAEVTHAVMRMASNDRAVVDNFHAGGIAAGIDISTGRLGPATDMGVTAVTQWWDSHPVTGGAITGRTMPFWDEIRDVACLAHAAFPDQIAIGWDIALVDGGPKLVEGNKGPDLDIVQRVCREPIGNSRFGELMAYHIERAFGTSVMQTVEPLPAAK